MEDFRGVNRLLSDPQFRHKILLRVKDPIVKAFWTQEVAQLHKTDHAHSE
ncbi:MAG: hypothetical protein ACREX9_03470 [Gammaproteobacteria bacterium]